MVLKLNQVEICIYTIFASYLAMLLDSMCLRYFVAVANATMNTCTCTMYEDLATYWCAFVCLILDVIRTKPIIPYHRNELQAQTRLARDG